MKRPYCKVADFVEDMYAIRSAGYQTKQDYCDRLGISMDCFEQRMVRARKRGLLPPAKIGSNIFDPFGEYHG